MKGIERFVQWRAVEGESVIANDLVVTPVSRALVVRFPFGGFVWNRPVAVRVDDGSKIRTLPISDVTRIAQIALIASGAFFTIVAWRFGRKENG